jgi:hypothetical protein
MRPLSFLKTIFAKESVAENSRETKLQFSEKIKIEFPKQYQNTDKNIIFPVHINGRRAGCKITYEALQDRFNFQGQDFADCFIVNRGKVQELARQLILMDPKQDWYLITVNKP